MVFIPPAVFPRLSRLCCCCCGAVPSMVVCPGVLWCQAVAGAPCGPKSKVQTSCPLSKQQQCPCCMAFLSQCRGSNPAAITSSNGIPVSRNPLTVNEDIGPFLSPCSSGLTAGCCVCLISPWGCLSGFIPVLFLQCDSSAHFASTACLCLLKFKLFLLSAFLPAYQYSLWVLVVRMLLLSNTSD